MGKIGLIIGREYLTRVKKKSFLVLTIVGPLLLALVMVGAIWFSMAEQSKYKILIVDDTKQLFQYFDQRSEKYEFYYVDNVGEDGFNQGLDILDTTDNDMLLYLPQNIIAPKQGGEGRIIYKKAPSASVELYLNGQVNEALEKTKLAIHQIPRETYDKLKAKASLRTISIDNPKIKNRDPEAVDEDDNLRMAAGVGFAFSLLIFFFIFMFGTMVMRGVIEEKSSRIIEVIISSVSPFQLMMGKIVGVALVGLTQIILWVIITAILMTVASIFILPPDMLDANVQAQMAVDMVGQDQMMAVQNKMMNLIFYDIPWLLLIPLFVFYFIGGYLLYSALFAAVGSAVDNEADSQQFLLPVTSPLMLAYIVSFQIMGNTDGPAAFWLSIIPFTSPVTMLMRVSAGTVTVWELLVSMGLLVGGFVFTTWLAGKIYRTGILMYGKKVTYKELYKWLFHK